MIFANFSLSYLKFGLGYSQREILLIQAEKGEAGTQRRIMIRLNERRYKPKKVKYLIGAKAGRK